MSLRLGQRAHLVGLVAAFCCASVPDAFAQSQVQQAMMSRMQLLNRQAMQDYDGLEFEKAKEKLVKALSVAKSAEITSGAVLARCYLNLGIVFGAGLKDDKSAMQLFAKAKQLEPNIKIDPARATPKLEKIFAAASGTSAPAPQPTTPPPAAPVPGAPTAPNAAPTQSPSSASVSVEHNVINAADRGERIRIVIRVSGSAAVRRCTLYYRSGEAEAFRRRELRHVRRTVYVGIIPAAATEADRLEYYVEAQGDSGERLAGSGSRSDPHTVQIEKDGREEGYEARQRGKGLRKQKTISVNLLVGTGGGIIFGGESEHLHPRANSARLTTVDIAPGGAWAPFHIAAEVGFHLNPLWELGVIGRVQLVNALSGASVKDKNKPSVLVAARAKRYLSRGRSRFYVSFGAGGGQVRHRVPLGDYDPNDSASNPTPDDIIDSRVAGVFALSVGGGFNIMFNHMFGWTIELNGMLIMPDHFAAQFDLNSGLLMAF